MPKNNNGLQAEQKSSKDQSQGKDQNQNPDKTQGVVASSASESPRLDYDKKPVHCFTAPLIVDENGTGTTFYEYDMPRDGDCGYHALGIPREEVAKKLLAHAHKASLRELVKGEIYDNLTSAASLPLAMKLDPRAAILFQKYALYLKSQEAISAKKKVLKAKKPSLNGLTITDQDLSKLLQGQEKYEFTKLISEARAFKKAVTECCATQEIYEAYIRHYISKPHQWLCFYPGPIDSSLDAIAEVYQLEVNVWRKDSVASGAISCEHRSTGVDRTKKINIIFVGNNHYNLLKEKPNLTIYPVLTAASRKRSPTPMEEKKSAEEKYQSERNEPPKPDKKTDADASLSKNASKSESSNSETSKESTPSYSNFNPKPRLKHNAAPKVEQKSHPQTKYTTDFLHNRCTALIPYPKKPALLEAIDKRLKMLPLNEPNLPIDLKAKLRLTLTSQGKNDQILEKGWLHAAVYMAKMDLVKILIEHGEDVCKRNKFGKKPIDYASQPKHADIKKYLEAQQKQSADYNARIINNLTQSIDPFKGIPLRYQSFSAWQPQASFILYDLCLSHKVKEVQRLLDLEVDPNQEHGENGQTALHISTILGFLDIVKILIKAGAKLDKASFDGYNPLHLAVSHNMTDITEWFIQAGASVDTPDEKSERTALHIACLFHNLKIVKFLLKYGANPNSLDINGYSPLHFAAQLGDVEIIKVLLRYGADSSKTTPKNGWSPLHFAVDNNKLDAVACLLEHQAKLEAVASHPPVANYPQPQAPRPTDEAKSESKPSATESNAGSKPESKPKAEESKAQADAAEPECDPDEKCEPIRKQNPLTRAFKTFGLPRSATLSEMTKKFKALSMKNHTDKGGCKETYQEIVNARDLLEPYLRQQQWKPDDKFDADLSGLTPLFFALFDGKSALVELLLRNGACLEKAFSACELYGFNSLKYKATYQSYRDLKRATQLVQDKKYFEPLFNILKAKLGDRTFPCWISFVYDLNKKAYSAKELESGLLLAASIRATRIYTELNPLSVLMRDLRNELKRIDTQTDKIIAPSYRNQLLKMLKLGFKVDFKTPSLRAKESLFIKIERIANTANKFNVIFVQNSLQGKHCITCSREIEFKDGQILDLVLPTHQKAVITLHSSGKLCIGQLNYQASVVLASDQDIELDNVYVTKLIIRKAKSVLTKNTVQSTENMICAADKLINQGRIESQIVDIRRRPGLRQAVTLDNRTGVIRGIQKLNISAGTLLNGKGELSSKESSSKCSGTLDNRNGRIIVGFGHLEVREDIHNRNGVIEATDGDLSVKSLVGKIHSQLLGKITSNHKLEVSAVKVLTDESSLIEGREQVSLTAVKNLRQETTLISKELALKSGLELDLKGRIASSNNITLEKTKGRGLFLCSRITAEKLLTIKAPDIKSMKALKAKDMQFTTHDLTLLGTTFAINTLEANINGQYVFAKNKVTAKELLKFNFSEGFTLTENFSNTGSVQIHIGDKARLPLNILADIHVGCRFDDEEKRKDKSLKDVISHITLTAKVPVNIGSDNAPYVTVHASGTTNIQSGAFDLIKGRVVGNDGIDIQSLSNMKLGRLPAAKEMPSGVISAGLIKLMSSDSITLEGTEVYGGQFNFKAPNLIDHIAGEMNCKGNALFDTPLFKHRLLAQSSGASKAEHSIATNPGTFMSHRVHQGAEFAITRPAELYVWQTLTTTGRLENFASWIHRENFVGEPPIDVTFIPYTKYSETNWCGDKQFKKSKWHYGTNIYNIYGTPILPKLSASKELLIQKEKLAFQGIISAVNIVLKGIASGQIGRFNQNVIFSFAKRFQPMVLLFPDIIKPSPLYEIAGSDYPTVMRSVIPMNLGITLPPLTILTLDGKLCANDQLIKCIHPPEQEAQRLVHMFMEHQGRGFLDAKTISPGPMLYRLIANAQAFRQSGQTDVRSIEEPLLVYMITDYENQPRLTPLIVLPKSWDNPRLRDYADVLLSLGDITIEGKDREKSQMLITAHLDAKGKIIFSNFKTLTHQKEVYKETIPVVNSVTKRGTLGNKKTTSTYQELTKTTAQPGNTLTARGVEWRNIGQLTLNGLTANVGEGGIVSRNVGDLIVTPIVESSVECFQSGRLKNFSGSKSTTHLEKYRYFPSSIFSLGSIDMEAGGIRLNSLVASSWASIQLTATHSAVHLDTTKLTQQLPPQHRVKGLKTSITTGLTEVGMTCQFNARGNLIIKAATDILGAAPQMMAKNVIMDASNKMKLYTLTLNTSFSTKTSGISGLGCVQSHTTEHHQSGLRPTLLAENNIELHAKMGPLEVEAPLFFAGNLLKLSSTHGDVIVKPVQFHHDVTTVELSATLSFFGSQSVEARMRGDYKQAALSLIREFPLIASVEDLLHSKDTADTVSNGLKTLYNAYKTYKAFAEGKNPISKTVKVRFGRSVSEQCYTEAVLPWLQARHIVMQAKNIKSIGTQGICENLSLYAEKNIDLEAAEQDARRRTQNVGVTVGFDFSNNTPSLGADAAKSGTKELQYLTSHFKVSNLTTIVAGDKISLKGVCIETFKAVLDAETLQLHTLQDTLNSSNKSASASTEGAAQASIGHRDRKYAAEQTGIIAQQSLIANIRKHVELIGAKIQVGNASPPIAAITPEGHKQTFYEHIMPGLNNDSGFYSLGVPRTLATFQLLAESNSLKIRKLVAPEIYAAVLSNELPKAMLTRKIVSLQLACKIEQLEIDKIMQTHKALNPKLQGLNAEEIILELSHPAEISHLQTKLSALQKNIDAIVEMCATKEFFEVFIKLTIQKPGYQLSYLGGTGTTSMDAIAEVNNLNLRIWGREIEHAALTVIHSYESKPSNRWVNLFHTDKLTHFNVLTSTPGHLHAQSLTHADIIDSDISDSASAGFSLGAQTAEFDLRSSHKKRINRATLAGNFSFTGNIDASRINRDASKSQEQTKDSHHHVKGFAFDPREMAKDVSNGIKNAKAPAVKPGHAGAFLPGFMASQKPKKEPAQPKGQKAEQPKSSKPKPRTRAPMNEQQLREQSDNAYLAFMTKGPVKEQPLKVLTAKEHPTTLVKPGPRLVLNQGKGMRPQVRDTAFSTLARNTLNFFISPAEASQMSQETRNYWNDPRVRKLAASKFTDCIDSVGNTPTLAKYEPMYYPQSRYSVKENLYWKRMAKESLVKGAAKIADVPFELVDLQQFVSDISPLKKYRLDSIFPSSSPFLPLQVISFSERHGIVKRPSNTIFNLLEQHGIDLNLAPPRNTAESFISGGLEFVGASLGTGIAGGGYRVLRASAGQFSKAYVNLNGLLHKSARFEQQRISGHLAEYAERVIGAARREMVVEVAPRLNLAENFDGFVHFNSADTELNHLFFQFQNSSGMVLQTNKGTGFKLDVKSRLFGTEQASGELLNNIRKKGREIVIAKPGSDDMRYLDSIPAEANVGGPRMTHILLKENPSKAALLEEFLHGTQYKLGIIDRLDVQGAEVHVKDFMIRHNNLLHLEPQDVEILKTLHKMEIEVFNNLNSKFKR